MKARETVMGADRMLLCSLRGTYCFDDVKDVILDACIAQAEISFKAGYEAGWKGERNFILHRDSDYKAGQRDVVEWIRNNAQEQSSYWHSNLFTKLAIDKVEWQAYKKEKGL